MLKVGLCHIHTPFFKVAFTCEKLPTLKGGIYLFLYQLSPFNFTIGKKPSEDGHPGHFIPFFENLNFSDILFLFFVFCFLRFIFCAFFRGRSCKVILSIPNVPILYRQSKHHFCNRFYDELLNIIVSHK